MNTERKQILEMLAAGKITADEAGRLLDKVGSGKEARTVEAQEHRKNGKPKYLRIFVESADGENVNVRVPLTLVKAGIKLKGVIPQHAHEKMQEKGVDLDALSVLDSEEFLDALRELHVDVDSDSGDTVRIFCE